MDPKQIYLVTTLVMRHDKIKKALKTISLFEKALNIGRILTVCCLTPS